MCPKRALTPAEKAREAGSPVLGYATYIEFGRHSGCPRRAFGPGWGDYAPTSIPMFGDGTDSFARVRWSGWGDQTALAYGVTLIFKPRGGHVEVPGELRATDLGRCHGRLAYRHVESRLLLKEGSHLHRHFKHANRWANYGWTGDHGNVCSSGPHALF